MVKNRIQSCVEHTKKCLTMSSCFRPAPCTPLPPRFWLRYRSVLVRLAYPVSVMVTTTSSRAMRSSSATSPSAEMMRVRRSSPYFSVISASSSLTMAR
ncbi:Uncharacterised protein [Mycobacteroides abscessus subsp. abscessus]|nr:Uncharacterised protein [Mycobacteroides abscessus subsp. abscessus]